MRGWRECWAETYVGVCACDGKNLLNKNLQIIIMKFNVNVNFGVAKCYDSLKALTFCKLKFGNTR